jgi:hypothetical protein
LESFPTEEKSFKEAVPTSGAPVAATPLATEEEPLLPPVAEVPPQSAKTRQKNNVHKTTGPSHKQRLLSSFLRKRESRNFKCIKTDWITAFAGMTTFREITKQGIPSVSSIQITQSSFGG